MRKTREQRIAEYTFIVLLAFAGTMATIARMYPERDNMLDYFRTPEITSEKITKLDDLEKRTIGPNILDYQE